MQGGIGHCHATDKYRFKPCHGCQCAGSPYLYIDAQHGGLFFLRREFSCDCPARRTRNKTQLLLERQAVNLENDPVDFKWQLLTLLLIKTVIRHATLYTAYPSNIFIDAQMPALQLFENIRVRVCQRAAGDLADTVAEHFQWPRGCHGRVQLTQAAGGCITWIHEGLLTLRLRLLVQLTEALV